MVLSNGDDPGLGKRTRSRKERREKKHSSSAIVEDISHIHVPRFLNRILAKTLPLQDLSPALTGEAQRDEGRQACQSKAVQVEKNAKIVAAPDMQRRTQIDP